MNIIVNGGTKGIGKEIVMLLARNKRNKILVTGRSTKILKQLSAGAVNGNITSVRIDLSDFASYRNQFARTVTKIMKNVDILINTAGSLTSEDFNNFSEEKAREMMQTNFFGPASMIRTLQPMMKPGAHIVNISSMGGYQGSSKFRGLSYYSASKAAIACLSECLAVEFSDSGISVNCLALGAVDTEMFKEAFPGFTAPVKPREMAQFIIDFAENAGRLFNGRVIPVAAGNP
jgi:NAD(P)-dependent dehydrogenase (short-subunit alcohol dehydrogenase family)